MILMYSHHSHFSFTLTMYLIGAGIITAILSRSMKITAKLQTVLSSIKILSCVFIIVAGVVNIIRTSRSLQPWI